MKKTPRTHKPVETCEPVYLRQLAEYLDTKEAAAELIGISAPHLRSCLKANETRIAYELAAKAKVNELLSTDDQPIFYLIGVTKDQQSVLDAFLKGMGIQAAVLVIP